jgi:UDP-N-acetylmuramoyl-tripeptide--D-alanyl-D-alanine ligase
MTVIVDFVLMAAAIASALRWLRVVQREHYLAGSTTRFALRWWASDAMNLVLVAVLGISLGACFWSRYGGFAVSIIVLVGPYGLDLKGSTSSLAWTQRLKRLAAISAAIYVLVGLILLLVIGGTVGTALFALLAVVVPVLIDGACVVATPIEARLTQPFIEQAAARLSALSPRVVAITGSYGKTSTKHHLAHVVSGSLTVVPSPRSFNNRAGLARAVNEHLVEGTQVFIAEMGTYGPGEIAELCSWCPPDIAVMTAIGPVHLERFGSLDITVAAKAEITERASTVVLNVDDGRLVNLVSSLEAQGKRVIQASATTRDATVALIADGERHELIVEGTSYGLVVIPEGLQVTNVACAVGASLALGLPLEVIVNRIASLPAVQNRLTVAVAPSGVRVIDDTFNANPAGARAALALLEAQAVSGRKIVVTPGMIELGPAQREENETFGARCAEVADIVVIVRRTNRSALKRGAERAGGCELRFEDTRDEAVGWVRQHLGPGDCVLYENDLPDNYP